MTQNRVTYADDGKLDEICADGGAHLERMGGKRWFLSCIRADGSEVCVWIKGKVTLVEERNPPQCRGCGAGIPANSATDGPYIMCPACGWSAKGGLRADPHTEGETQ